MTLVRLALVALLFALATAVNFQASDADIRNPERGMHWQREVDVSSTCTAAATYSWFAGQKSTIDKYTKATSGAKSCWQKPDDESAPYAQCNARGCQRPDCKSCTLCDSDAAKQADEELNALSSKKYACKALKSTELANDAAAQRSLVLRLYYLTDYKTRSLDDDFFFLFDQDMRQLRDAGHKAILRFAYSKAYSDTEIQAAGGNDATLAQVKTHIDNLAPHLRENGDVISHFQAGFVGPWGEWHSSSNCLEGNPAMSEIVGKIAAAVGPTTPIQLRNPIDKQTVSGHGITSADQARLGLYNDCFLASDTDKGTYGRLATVCHDTNPSEFSQSCPTLNHETKCCCRPTNSSAVHSDKATVADWASTGPQLVMGGETCATSAVATCPNALRDLARFRWTHLNAAYNLPVLNSWSQCMPEIQRKLGYRLVLESAKVTPKVKVGCALKLTLVLRNDGFAAPIRNRPIILSLSEGNPLPLPDVDLRTLGPGKHTIERDIAIPLSVSLGKHDLSLSLPDPNDKLAKRADYAIRLANTNIYDAATGRHKLNLKVNAIKNTAAQKIQAKIKKAAGNAKAVSKLNKKLNNLLWKCSTVRSTDEADVEDSDADDDSDGALSFASFFDSEDFEDNDVEDSDSEEEEDSDSVDWDAIFADGDDDE